MDIALAGSIAYDYIMRFPGKFADHIIPEKIDKISLSFLVDEMTKHWGGVSANIAYTLAMLKLEPRPKLVGTAGKDFGDYRDWLENVGVDTSTVRQIDSVFTASFFVNTDTVNNQIASFYTGAMAFAKEYTLAELLPQQPDLVVISPNDPLAMQQQVAECAASGIPFMYDPSQQVARFDGEPLKKGIEAAQILICNEYEFELIMQKTGLSREAIIEQVGGDRHAWRKRHRDLYGRPTRSTFPFSRWTRSPIRPGWVMPSGPGCCAAWQRAGTGNWQAGWVRCAPPTCWKISGPRVTALPRRNLCSASARSLMITAS
jgi:sugar/nucleoside kinase (ribokinase family)